MDLTVKTLISLIWSALEVVGNFGIQFIVQICLARLLLPAEFGLVELLIIFLTLSQAVVDGGFTQALIQKKELNRIDISTAFFFNLFVAIGLYAVLFFSAPAIGAFYGEPKLVPLMRWLAVSVLIGGFGRVNVAILTRRLAFRDMFRISLPSLIISGTIGIGSALAGLGVWSLVIHRLSSILLLNFGYWWAAPSEEQARFEFSWASLREMQRFGLGMLGSSLLSTGVQNFYGLAIGKAFPFGQLAFYNRARQFHRVPVQSVVTVFNRVMFPVFSTIQHDNEKIRKALRNGLPIVIFVVAPMMIFLIVAAKPIVILLLTRKWLMCVELMRWFPLTGILFPSSAVLLSVVRAKGYTNLHFWLDVVKNTLALIVLFMTLRHSVLAIVVGQVGVSLVGFSINMLAAKYVFGYRIRDQITDIVWYVGAAVIAGVAAGSLELLDLPSMFLLLVCQAVVFAGIYLFICRILGLTALDQGRSMLTRFMKQRAKAKNAQTISASAGSMIPSLIDPSRDKSPPEIFSDD